MAKAFTEKERIQIKEKILETAIELFHDKGTKSLNIKKLTNRVGISQGSFYNFWKNKESLVIDLIAYRSMQKLSEIENNFAKSFSNPVDFLSNIIYEYSMDLISKIETQKIYKDAFKIFLTREKNDLSKVDNLYVEFLKKLIYYWKINNIIEEVDEKGLSAAFIGSFILCSNFYHFEKNYFADVLKIYIYDVVNQYIKIKSKM